MAEAAVYGRGQIILHWLTVALVVPQIAVSGGISARFAANQGAGAVAFDMPAVLHMGFGGLILFLVMLRLMLRQEAGVAAPVAGAPAWRGLFALWVHRALYGVLLLLPLTGALAWGLGSVPLGRVHDALHMVLIGGVLLHVAGALFGQFARRDGTLARMLPVLRGRAG